jgi:hypothetical protein
MKQDVPNSKPRVKLGGNVLYIQNKTEMVPRIRLERNLAWNGARWKGDFELRFQDEDGNHSRFLSAV